MKSNSKKYFAGALLATQLGAAANGTANTSALNINFSNSKNLLKNFFAKNIKALDITGAFIIVLLLSVYAYLSLKNLSISYTKSGERVLSLSYSGKEGQLEELKKKKLKSGDILEVTFEVKDDYMNSNNLKNLIKSLSAQLQLGQDAVLLFNGSDDEQKYDNSEGLEQRKETKITLKFKYYKKNEYMLEKYNKMENIEDLFAISNIVAKASHIKTIVGGSAHSDVDKKGKSEGFDQLNDLKKSQVEEPNHLDASKKAKVEGSDCVDASTVFHNFILGTGVVDSYVTRNILNKNKKILENVDKWSEEDGPFKQEFSKLKDVLVFFEKLVKGSLQIENKEIFKLLAKEGSEEHYKYNVSNNPTAADLIKNILCAEALKKEGDKNFKDEAYRQLLCKFIEYIIVSRENMQKTENNERILFELFLLLRNKKVNTTEAAKLLVNFLKKYISEDDQKTVKEKFLKNLDDDFAALFNEDNKNVENGNFFIFKTNNGGVERVLNVPIFTGSEEEIKRLKEEIKGKDILKINTKFAKGNPGEDLNKLIISLDDKVLFPTNYEMLALTEEDFEFECKDASTVVADYFKKYKNIKTLEEFSDFSEDLVRYGMGYGFCPRSHGFMILLCSVCSTLLGDQSYTRNSVKAEEENLKVTLDWVKKKATNFEKDFSQYCEAANLLKEVIKNSLQKNGFEKLYNNSGKFLVRSDPDAFDIVQYILCAEELKVKRDTNVDKNEEKVNNREEVIFPRDEVYIQHFLCKFAMYAIVSPGNCFKNKLTNDDKKKLFDLFLKLRDKKGNATELALEFVSLLKNYVEPENLKLLKEKGFLGKVDARFAKVLGLENEIVDNAKLISPNEKNINES